MKFKPGDLVWVHVEPNSPCYQRKILGLGEYQGVVIRYAWEHPKWGTVWDVEIAGESGEWESDAAHMRPRRDDYQQHEGLGSMDKINQPLDLTERSLEWALEDFHDMVSPR